MTFLGAFYYARRYNIQNTIWQKYSEKKGCNICLHSDLDILFSLNYLIIILYLSSVGKYFNTALVGVDDTVIYVAAVVLRT